MPSYPSFLDPDGRRKDIRHHRAPFPSTVQKAQTLDQIVNVAGEILLQINSIIEVDNESFILGIVFLRKCQCGAVDPLPLIPHAPAVIDDQTNTQGHIFMFEERDLLNRTPSSKT